MSKKIKTQFKEELKKGTGKTILLFRRYHKKIDFRKELIEAAIHNPDYDPQCSGTRAGYLYEMIWLLPNRIEIENKILKRFLKTYRCSVQQLFRLALLFSKNGNDFARAIIYKKFKKEIRTPDGGAGGDEIVELDGLSGLHFVAEGLGRSLIAKETYWEDIAFIRSAEEILNKKNLLGFLRKAGKSNSQIRVYVQAVEKSMRNKKKWKRLSYSEVKSRIDHNKQVPLAWSFNASKKELLQAAYDLLKEQDKKKLLLYLKLFSYRTRFPLGYKPLLNWKKFDTNELKERVFILLSVFKSSEIHKLAISNLKNDIFIGRSMQLLKRNFEERDANLVSKVLKWENDPDEFHLGAMNIRDMCSKKRPRSALKLLLPIYKRGYCAGCRERLVRTLVKNRIMPAWIRKETLLDSDFDTRQYVKRYGKLRKVIRCMIKKRRSSKPHINRTASGKRKVS